MASTPISPQDAAGAVLQAARLAFESRGYAGTTLKSVAVAAGVAPDVLKSVYQNKERLFAAAMRLPFDPAQAIPELIAPGLDGMGDRLVRMALTLMDDDKVRADLTRLVSSEQGMGATTGAARAAASSESLAQLRLVSEYFSSTVVDGAVAAVGVPDARLRVGLITSHLLGLMTTRYLLRLEPVASASEDELVALIGPAIQALLDPTNRVTGPGQAGIA